MVSCCCIVAFGSHQRGYAEGQHVGTDAAGTVGEHVGANASSTVGKHISTNATSAMGEHVSAYAAGALEVDINDLLR